MGRFLKDEDGSVTVEMAIWSPMLISAIVLILDFAYMMVVNADMWHAARNTARALSIHRITPSEAPDYLRRHLFFANEPYDIAVTLGPETVYARVVLASADAALTPVVGRYVAGELRASISMLREPF